MQGLIDAAITNGIDWQHELALAREQLRAAEQELGRKREAVHALQEAHQEVCMGLLLYCVGFMCVVARSSLISMRWIPTTTRTHTHTHKTPARRSPSATPSWWGSKARSSCCCGRRSRRPRAPGSGTRNWGGRVSVGGGLKWGGTAPGFMCSGVI